MSRKSARETAYKLIFEYIFNKEKDSLSAQALLNNPNVVKEDVDFTTSLYSGAVERFDVICESIKKHAQGYSFDRIYKPDLAALILAIYEMTYTDTPKTVAITEALDIVKMYSTNKSSAYVNGILASVYKDLMEDKND